MLRRRWPAIGMTMVAVLGGLALEMGAAVAAVPTHAFPTLEFQSMITTQPIKGSTTTIGDAEGLAEDPIRKTIWVLDDAKHSAYEINLADGTLSSTVTQAQLAATLQYQPGGAPAGPAAGLTRPVDMEGLAYDDVHDQLFIFAGPCCPALPHDPTAFRLTRPSPGAAFVPDSFQPLNALAYNDFSGAAARQGVLWVAQGKTVFSYDYPTNTLSAPSVAVPISGVSIYGIDFNDDGSELWLTDTSDRLYRLAFPSLAVITAHNFSMRDFNIDDPRAVEVVGDRLYVADGDDLVSPGSSRRFALHIFSIGHSPPGASFTSDVSTTTVGSVVSLTDTSVRRPQGWSWNFGDGATTTARSPFHVYADPGVYTVAVTVTNPNGSSSALTKIVVNPASATAAFSADPTQGPAPLNVTFTDQTVGSDPLVPVTMWSWNFGDGSPIDTLQHPVHVYNSPGEYFVELQATAGVTTYRLIKRIIVEGPPTASFDTTDALAGLAPFDVTFIDRSTGSPAPTKWRWDFGDGTKSSLQHPLHTYTTSGTFTAKLTVTNAASSSSTTKTVVVQSGPQTTFTATPLFGPAPLTVVLTNTTPAVSPPVTGYLWDFGDGTPTVPGPNTSHVYTSPGTYSVKLSATNDVSTVTATRVINVEGLPTASFVADRTSLSAPGDVVFTDTSTGTPSPSTWTWDFGDGTANSSLQHPTHTFATAGTFAVGLTVTNSRGSSTTSTAVTVVNAPLAAFTRTPASGVVPLSVAFTDISTGRPAPTTWRWDFGDATPVSTDRNPTHVYRSTGTFTVALTVTSANGTSTVSQQVAVLPVPPAEPGFAGLTPARLMDTRPAGRTVDDLFAATGRLGQSSRVELRVLGRGNVPATGVGAVALNVTAVEPGDESYLTVWPTGGEPPNASNLNFTAGQTVPNMVIVAVGVRGSVSLFNAAGSTDVVVDVLGWFPSGTSFGGLTPARLMDTRAPGLTTDRQFSGAGALAAAGTVRLPVLDRGGVPAAGVGSVVLNVTATGATVESYLTVWPTGRTKPNASNLNFAAARTVPNMVIVPVGGDGSISIFNATGQTHVLVDVLGWIPSGPSYTGLTPARLMDTRGPGLTDDGVASGGGAVRAGGQARLMVRGRGGVPASGVASVAINVTAVGPTAVSYLTVWPSDRTKPNASNLNLSPRTTVANMVIVPLAADGSITIFNAAGSTDVLVDVLGWFP